MLAPECDTALYPQSEKSNGLTLWFTNLEHKLRYQSLDLRGNYYHGNEAQFPKYDNNDAIEVSKVAEIPCDYFEAFFIPTTALASLDPDKVQVVTSQAELDTALAAGDGREQYIVRLYEDYAEVLTAEHSKEDTAAFLHAQGIEEADMRYQSGVMGVPITFLDKYCPEQFEIIDINPHFFSIVEKGGQKPKQLSLRNYHKKDPYARILVLRRQERFHRK